MTLVECRDTKLWPVLWVHHKCLYLEGQSQKKQPEKDGRKHTQHTHTQKSTQEDLRKKKAKKKTVTIRRRHSASSSSSSIAKYVLPHKRTKRVK
jgi:hypothetical protein